jgi:hypothetical protein
MLKEAGADGINKIIAAFHANHPNIPKRQVELKINEMAVKEKRPSVSDKIIWHLRSEFEKYLDMDNFEGSSPAPTAPKGKGGKKSGTATGASAGEESKGGKRKRESEGVSVASVEAPPPAAGDGAMPKKYKRAFGFFVKAKRAEAAQTLGNNNVSTTFIAIVFESVLE